MEIGFCVSQKACRLDGTCDTERERGEIYVRRDEKVRRFKSAEARALGTAELQK